MKVIHLNTHDSAGGAAIAAQRLHLALRGADVESFLAVAQQHDDGAYTIPLGSKLVRRVVRPVLYQLERKLVELFYSRPNHPAFTTFSLLPSRQHKRINSLGGDILHLHWLGEGFLTPWALGRLHGPVVWTMHDTWPFTGGCHYSASNCMNYTSKCGNSPELCSKREYDLSRLHWHFKRAAIRRLQPVMVSLSAEYAYRAAQSGMLQGCRIEHIPNCIDTGVFKPIEKSLARKLLGLPQDAEIILFGAMAATSDNNKGFDLLCNALNILRTKSLPRLMTVVFGASHGDMPVPFPIRFLGKLHDSITLTLAYSAADVFVCPSRQESFSNTVLESLACGTPVAAFAVGGIPDMVEHKVNGWLASPQDCKDLAEGIAFILEDGERRNRMREAARRTVEEKYAAPVIARRYLDLYEEITAQKHA